VECAVGSGDLTIVGSTAFEQAAERAKTDYLRACGDANITVSATGSRAGVEQLLKASTEGRERLLAFSDGRAEDPNLRGTPVAVAVFAVVVNSDADVTDLTRGQVRDIAAGRIDNWSELGGADLPIRMVGRDTNSGSRRAFERLVLGGPELAASSSDCTRADLRPEAPVFRCEAGSTGQLLERVNGVSGAIGYADAATTDAGAFPNLVVARLGGILPTPAQLSSGSGPGYPFWTVEYVYSSDTPPAGTLRASFLAYLRTDSARVALREAGYLPCVNQDGTVLAQCARPQQ
jgi:ABC-type phosphate transport system substrate-binding protein